ncbi:hypothetical protein WU86_02945 [Corynebacterium xerosis]|nr:hypothetical protein WU86_02945 [Corynebacterium xerosis]
MHVAVQVEGGAEPFDERVDGRQRAVHVVGPRAGCAGAWVSRTSTSARVAGPPPERWARRALRTTRRARRIAWAPVHWLGPEE